MIKINPINCIFGCICDSLCFMSSDAIVSQVLDELGLNLSDELSSKRIQHTTHSYMNSTYAPFIHVSYII